MIWDQIFWWQTNDEYSFGYLVPLFAAYVLYDRWPQIQSYLFRGVALGKDCPSEAPRRGLLMVLFEWVAFLGLLSGILLFFVGGLLRGVSGPQNPASLAISMGFAWTLLFGAFIFSKERGDGVAMGLGERLAFTCLFIFPALIWLLSAPMVSVLQKAILVFLQSQVTSVVFLVFDLVGASLEREGSVLILNGEDRVGVEEACSGIRSLTACLFAGSFLAAVFLNKFWKKVLLIGAAMGLAFITNMCRALFLTYWAYSRGSGAIDEHGVLPLIGDIGSVHDVTGFLILGVTCMGLLCLLPIFNYSPEVPDAFSTEDSEDAVEGPEASDE
ncbi:MAG: exosortase [Verrucomicrobia bacterium]|nr:exosortase [Verrucomicrobiota bacterium]